MGIQNSRLWVLKSKGIKSSFGGNLGYADKPFSTYLYDTTVKNHDKLKEGDFVVVADKENIIGFARIESIEVKKGSSKTRFRCPVCKTQEFYKREGLIPPYRCRNKHVFEKRIEEEIFVDNYIASYGSSFVECKPRVGVEVLAKYYIKRNLYYSIQTTDINLLNDKFPNIVGLLKKSNLSNKQFWGNQDVSNIPLYVPVDQDDREVKLKRGISRQGQTKFKEDLLNIYGPICMITEVYIPITIQASHIWPYRGKKDNNPRNGLLLRADLHILYDADLIGIDPIDLSVHLHPSIKNSYYKRYDHKKIKFKRKDFSPSKEAITLRWLSFQSKLRN